ncbi:MAG: hypothetical protein ACXVLQ_16920 [Bacteriovorax sp.]
MGPFIFAQTPPVSDQSNHGQIEEVHDTENLDKVIKDYNKDTQKVLKDAETIKEMDSTAGVTDKELGEEAVVAPDEAQANQLGRLKKSLYQRKIDPKDQKKMSYADSMRVALEPLQKMSEAELVKILNDNTRGTNTAAYLERFPKITVFTVRLIKDPNALPWLAKIIDEQDKLIRFVGIMLSTILVAFFLKKLMKKEGRGIFEAMGFWFIRFLIINSLRFGLLIYFYGKEIHPTINIAIRTFF